LSFWFVGILATEHTPVPIYISHWNLPDVLHSLKGLERVALVSKTSKGMPGHLWHNMVIHEFLAESRKSVMMVTDSGDYAQILVNLAKRGIFFRGKKWSAGV
jgi:hypothetical protein